MHISLTPTLESKVRNKVNSGMYNNASEVVREALRFMDEHDELVEQMKLNHLRQAVALGAEQADQGQFSSNSVEDIIHQANHNR